MGLMSLGNMRAFIAEQLTCACTPGRVPEEVAQSSGLLTAAVAILAGPQERKWIPQGAGRVGRLHAGEGVWTPRASHTDFPPKQPQCPGVPRPRTATSPWLCLQEGRSGRRRQR